MTSREPRETQDPNLRERPDFRSAFADRKTAGSAAMFDRLAPRYDALNRVMSLGVDQSWRRRSVSALALGERPTTVLDVATGTGDLAIAIAREWTGAHVVGLDPSAGMLDVARSKLRALSLESRIDLVEGSADALPFADGAFDAATIAFGIRNVPDREGCLREMARVIAPGGRVVVLELTDPESGFVARVARFHIHTVVPALGALFARGSEYRYLERSIAALPPPSRFAELAEASGLVPIELASLTFGAAFLLVAEKRARP